MHQIQEEAIELHRSMGHFAAEVTRKPPPKRRVRWDDDVRRMEVALTMEHRESYYLLAVDKETDFLWALPTTARADPLPLARPTAAGNFTTAMERVQPKGLSNRIEDVFVPFASAKTMCRNKCGCTYSP